jgi:hypothetical protein
MVHRATKLWPGQSTSKAGAHVAVGGILKVFWSENRTAMNIEIHDTALEARIRKQIRATGAANAEQALLHLLETQEEQDRWLLENKNANNAKIRRGIDQLDRGQGIPEDELDSWLATMKSRPE